MDTQYSLKADMLKVSHHAVRVGCSETLRRWRCQGQGRLVPYRDYKTPVPASFLWPGFCGLDEHFSSCDVILGCKFKVLGHQSGSRTSIATNQNTLFLFRHNLKHLVAMTERDNAYMLEIHAKFSRELHFYRNSLLSKSNIR